MSPAARDLVRRLLCYRPQERLGGSRGGQEVALRQEVADSKSLLIEQAAQIAGLVQAIGQLAAAGGGALSGLDLEAVEAAARRGAQTALADARVVVELGGGAA